MVETASVDAHRKLILIRRDTVEHLIMTGGPVDVLIKTGIEGPPLEDAIIAHAETRPAPDFSKTENRPSIRLCKMAKFVLDRDTPATVVSLVASAKLR